MNLKIIMTLVILLLIGAGIPLTSSNFSQIDNDMISEKHVESTLGMNPFLYVTVTTDKSIYDIGEPVEVTINVTNNGIEGITSYFPDIHSKTIH